MYQCFRGQPVALGQILDAVWLLAMPRLREGSRRVTKWGSAAAKGLKGRNEDQAQGGQESAARRNRGLSKREKPMGSSTRNLSSVVPLEGDVSNRVGVARGYFLGH